MIRPATVQDAHALAKRVRKADRMELAAASGASPLKALLHGARRSADARVFEHNGVQAVYGVIETGPGEGSPWMIGSSEIFGKAKLPFARVSRSEIESFLSRWPRLHGWVHAANAAHVRWLEWCGFTLAEPKPWGVRGEPFRYFERTALNV